MGSDCDFLLPHSSSFILAPTSTSENGLMASFVASLMVTLRSGVTLGFWASRKLMAILSPPRLPLRDFI